MPGTMEILLETTYSDFIPGDNQAKLRLSAELHEGTIFNYQLNTFHKDGSGWGTQTFWNPETAIKGFLKELTKLRKEMGEYRNVKINQIGGIQLQ